MRPARKAIFDTNIYISAIRKGPTCREYGLLIQSLPFSYLSSVVSAELYAGALDSAGLKLVRDLVSRFRRARRVITPTHNSWNHAGQLLARIGLEEPKYKSKIHALFNDTLIVLSALQIGAVVYTADEEDYTLIWRRRKFDLQIIGTGNQTS